MDEKPKTTPAVTEERQVTVHAARGLSSQALARAIFKAELPEEVIRALPAQSLYMAVKHNGLGSSADLIESATNEQTRMMLDFDLWDNDEIDEDNFWEWLAVTDAQNDLSLLQKVVKCIDLKVICFAISKYVQVITKEDPSDVPPELGYYTPDNGSTWLKVEAGDETKNFLLTRTLAMIFETSAELFYQLLAIPDTTTLSMLLEEGYQDKSKRLATEGIPDRDFAHELTQPLPLPDVLRELTEAKPYKLVRDIRPIEPMLYEPGRIEPIDSLLAEARDIDALESELTLVMNAAVVRFSVPFDEQEQVLLLTQKVKGAANIGLQVLEKSGTTDLSQAFATLGITKLFRLGMSKLRELRKLAVSISDEQARKAAQDLVVFAILAGSREQFPQCPEFLRSDGTADHDAEGKLRPGYRAFMTLIDVETVQGILEKARGL